ncbi:hypothetical protein O181_039327 [Austropuccinia psidii MF-1]|uniref:Uncharacterized protein n=1 Tax=Austropuccinia psidii MF-1 TaxID=1389203 RepID=A0A9Q3DCP3_9BASI|nr:hypothetical protein [Austropuccinia psidii MF-1]
MTSSGHFDPVLGQGKRLLPTFQPKIFKVPFLLCCSGPSSSNIRLFLWSKKDGPFGKELPVFAAPTPDGTSGYSDLTSSRKRDVTRWTNVGGPIPVGGRPIYSISEVPISRINTKGVVNRIRWISAFPPDPEAEGSDQLDDEEAEIVHNSICHPSSTSPSHPPSKRFQSHIIARTPRTFQPTFDTLPASLSSSTTRPAFIPAVRPSPIPQSRYSPIVTSQQLQPVDSSSRRREELSPLPFSAAQVFQQREHWPI